jgi:hypothetical protein
MEQLMKRLSALVFGFILVFCASASVYYEPAWQGVNPNPPDSPVRLIFIHHSTGENWLNDDNGGLARALQKNNYYPSDTNYGWGPDAIGDRTDIPNWLEWFRSENTPQIMQAVFQEGEVHSPFARTLTDPGGENQIILFKSCFPNSALDGSPDDPPSSGSDLNVGNAKYIYNEILQYFKTRPDKLFVVITAPPLTDGTFAANARAFNQWLVNDWLREDNYTLPNVAVFDFYNVLTGPNNHHRFTGGQIEHVINDKRNTEFYPSEDDHPNRQGNQKATTEFLPMLNIFYNRWKASAPTTAAAQPPATNPQAQSTENQGQQSVQSPADAVPAAGGLLFDFESEQPLWEASVDEAAQTTALDCQINTANAGSGGQSMQIVFNVAANSWATCSSFFDAPRDLSAAAGIQFMLRLQDPPGEMHLDVFTGPDGERATYARQIPLPDSTGKWSIIQTRWSDLKRVEWEADGGTVFSHPEQITGLAFGFPAGNQVNHGIIQIDDIQTFSSGAAPAQVANPPAAAPAAEQPALAAPQNQESTGQKTRSGRIMPFCGSILLVPLAAVAAAGRKRK